MDSIGRLTGPDNCTCPLKTSGRIEQIGKTTVRVCEPNNKVESDKVNKTIK